MKKPRTPILPPKNTPLRRLPDVPFPTYRFVPGLQEHPERSKTHKMPNITLSQCWDYGWDLFEHNYWWEAHEVWERLWKEMPLFSDEQWSNEHPERRFVQGHILLSASKLLEHMGRPHDAMRQKAQRYMRVITRFE